MILLGTIHNDRKGPHRLEFLLQKYKPKSLTIEMPEDWSFDYALSYCEVVKEGYKINLKNALKELCGRYTEKPAEFFCDVSRYYNSMIDTFLYESTITINYAVSTNSKLYFVDHPKISDFYDTEKLDNSSFLPSGGVYNLPHFLNLTMDASYIPNEFWYIGWLLSGWSIDFMNEREQFIADKILRLQPDFHIGGLAHIFGEKGVTAPIIPLYQRLKNIPFERIKLIDADKIS